MPGRKKSLCLFLVSMLSICAVSQAALIVDGAFDGSIKQSYKWAAGYDKTEMWYGMDYTTKPDYAELTFGGKIIGMVDKAKAFPYDEKQGQRGLIQAIEVPKAGKYQLSLDALFSNYTTQYSYWNAYLVRHGAAISLAGKVNWYSTSAKEDTKLLTSGKAGVSDKKIDWNSKADWHSYSSTFEISEKDIFQYDYLALTFVGSKNGYQKLGFDNVTLSSASVPEPMTAVLLALGGLVLLKRRQAS